MDDMDRDDLSEILERLIASNQLLGQKITALTMVCVYLLKERCQMADDPASTLVRIEGELGGLSEAVSRKFASGAYDGLGDTAGLTRLIESILTQLNDSVRKVH